ncbi:MAG: hypothetical protein C0482_26545 [Gordonia sp.]|uniref:hypothetical protein n=1 Tax=Williamsia sp. 1138 TaxID=1903117 RepID=UPI000A10A01B|nr:hypothetical protein [Williamsia sp. 1138]MBA4025922.1 hypothetical protein [Gordonia sp. (in: high G+C Gram-positive bacteria)]OZG27983.1 hypothetical protein BH683_017065 [Williamsia sp. 1138]
MKLPASKIDVKTMAILLGAGRAGLGLGYMFAPKTTAQGVIGTEAALPGAKLTNRMFGAREVYLGGVVVAAAQAQENPLLKKLLLSGAGVDAWDATAALTTGGIPKLPKYALTAVAVSYAALGVYIAAQIPDKT